MEVTRIRELTQPSGPFGITFEKDVEMELTRIRELTLTLHCCSPFVFPGRNGTYPNKGIDTLDRPERKI